jgi:hypothetical protein
VRFGGHTGMERETGYLAHHVSERLIGIARGQGLRRAIGVAIHGATSLSF